MDMFSIDASDDVYQSYRSNTTMVLNIGSLVSGVGGIVKGVVAFNRLANLPSKIKKIGNLRSNQLRSGNGFLGHKEFELKNATVQPIRNNRVSVQGRSYSGHALDQMQNRGLMPSVVEETIKNGSHSVGKNPGTMAYYDPANNVTVVLNTEGRIITISYGDINQ